MSEQDNSSDSEREEEIISSDSNSYEDDEEQCYFINDQYKHSYTSLIKEIEDNGGMQTD